MDEIVRTHETTRTQQRVEAGTLYGLTCSCGYTERPRYAAQADADRAAARHSADPETDR